MSSNHQSDYIISFFSFFLITLIGGFSISGLLLCF